MPTGFSSMICDVSALCESRISITASPAQNGSMS
jgi:hypothetical protein